MMIWRLPATPPSIPASRALATLRREITGRLPLVETNQQPLAESAFGTDATRLHFVRMGGKGLLHFLDADHILGEGVEGLLILLVLEIR